MTPTKNYFRGTIPYSSSEECNVIVCSVFVLRLAYTGMLKPSKDQMAVYMQENRLGANVSVCDTYSV